MLLATLAAQADVEISTTNFPDVKFRDYMLSLYPQGYMTTDQVNNLTELDVRNKGIENLKGVELLTGLKVLDCSNNRIVSLDLKMNTELTSLTCWNNNLYVLNVNNNPNLTFLACNDNKLSTLKLTMLSKLEKLYCFNNQLTSINWPTPATSALEIINCSNNQLTSLVVNNYRNLTTINAQNNLSLSGVNCAFNAMTTLDLTGCTAMKQLWCYYNSNLTGITGLADCTGLTVFVFDNCSFSSIDLVPFTKLTFLNCCNNQLTSLDLSTLTALQKFYCRGNQISSLDLSGKTDLQEVYCENNRLGSLNVGGCTSLRVLDCFNNQFLSTITSLTDCKALTQIDCGNCIIDNLDGITRLTNLHSLIANNNRLTEFWASGMSTLYNINLEDNIYLTKIWALDNPVLNTLRCSNCPSLTQLVCSRNDLSWLDVSGCTSLVDCTCYLNHITDEGMTTLVNSLPKRSADSPGELFVYYKANENNLMTDAQIAIAQRKNWQSKKYNGYVWETMTVSLLVDVNGDGTMSISDVSALIDLILTGNTAVEANPGADVDFDGEITVKDVTDLIDMILNGN